MQMVVLRRNLATHILHLPLSHHDLTAGLGRVRFSLLLQFQELKERNHFNPFVTAAPRAVCCTEMKHLTLQLRIYNVTMLKIKSVGLLVLFFIKEF